MLTQIATECPETTCEWSTFHFYPEPILHTHLVEKHGYQDTTAHVVANQVVNTPTEETRHTCRWCRCSLGIHDDAAWDEWTTVMTYPAQDPAVCHQSPNQTHQPIGA